MRLTLPFVPPPVQPPALNLPIYATVSANPPGTSNEYDLLWSGSPFINTLTGISWGSQQTFSIPTGIYSIEARVITTIGSVRVGMDIFLHRNNARLVADNGGGYARTMVATGEFGMNWGQIRYHNIVDNTVATNNYRFTIRRNSGQSIVGAPWPTIDQNATHLYIVRLSDT